MKYSYPGFRPKITVFGETYTVVDINDTVDADDPVVLYQIKGKETPHPKAAAMSDWMEWDANAKRAKDA